MYVCGGDACVCVGVCVCMCVCVCVVGMRKLGRVDCQCDKLCERERGRESKSLCVCVCSACYIGLATWLPTFYEDSRQGEPQRHIACSGLCLDVVESGGKQWGW